MRALGVTLLLLSATACTFYFDDDDDDDDSIPIDDEPCERVPLLLVDPYTLTCQDFGSPCGGYPTDLPALIPPIPTWGRCESECSALDQLTCVDTPGCRVTYDWACFTGNDQCPAESGYLGCFAVDTTGPVQGLCDGLDAFACSQHDDCIALHDLDDGTTFVECRAEWGAVPQP